MQTDSIRENLTKDDIIAYIELELNADIEHNLCFVLVEGSSDKKWGRNNFEQNVVFYESFSGKEGLKELVDSISDQRVIAIRDRDYADVRMFPSRMFVYDNSCLEMMLLKNEDVFRGFCNVYCKTEHYDISILHDAMRAIAPYSIARKKNEEQSLGINFRHGFGDLIKEEDPFPIDELFERVGISDDLRELCKREASQLHIDNLYDITNGHDICKYLGCIAAESKGKTLGEERVQNILICSYRRDDFRRTELYHSLKTYQNQCDLKFVD